MKLLIKVRIYKIAYRSLRVNDWENKYIKTTKRSIRVIKYSKIVKNKKLKVIKKI